MLAVETINLTPKAGSQFEKLSTSVTVQGTISFFVTASLVVAGIVFFFMLVWGGIEWIVSGGDKAGAENARKRITNALIGLAIVFSAWAIIKLIQAVFGIDLTKLDIPTITQ